MSIGGYHSWAYQPEGIQRAVVPAWQHDLIKTVSESKATDGILAYGNGRSYGDSCLNRSGLLLDVRAINHIISFDIETGLLVAEPGITLAQILSVCVPKGWFLPVSPGTSQVTLGGAIANDVHGKNHHRDGTFGRFVSELDLLRSDGESHRCSALENADLFSATIGGLGLTGVITKASLQLISVKSSMMDTVVVPFHGLDEFIALSQSMKGDYQYTVAWLDCAADGDKFARGVFLAANHANSPSEPLSAGKMQSKRSVPFALPSWVLNRYSIKAFNEFYFYWQSRGAGKPLQQHFVPYFYPLDAIADWNRIYGSRGFYQYQFVVPVSEQEALEHILQLIVASGMGSFLAVLKEFGDITSPGMLSFPRPGLCLALDFSNRGNRTVKLINQIDGIVRQANGAAYPAKDRLMSAESFSQYFPKLDQFLQHTDPQFTSDFWKRVNG